MEQQQNPYPPTTSTTIINYISPNPPPFPSSPRTVDLSPLEFVLALVAVIIIPALIYTFFYSIKCPSRRRSRTTGNDSDDFLSTDNDNISLPNNPNPPNPTSLSNKEVVSDVKYSKEIHVKEIGSECPVCLSVFAEGEDVKQLSNCKHSFHSTCIDLWLNSHSNCPVCRASVPVKRPNNNNNTAATTNNNGSSSSSRSRRDHSDFYQGLPGAADLV